MSDTSPELASGADPWAPVQHEEAPPEPKPTPEKPIKVAAHTRTRAPRQAAEPKAEASEPAAAGATLPLALSVAVPTDLMAALQGLVASQRAVIAKVDELLDKLDKIDASSRR